MVQVEMSEFPMPFDRASIVLRLQELGPEQVEIKLEFDFDVNDSLDAEMLKPTMNQGFAEILGALDQHLVTGERIDNLESLDAT